MNRHARRSRKLSAVDKMITTKQDEKKARAMIYTIPFRLIKGIVAFVLFIPMTAIALGIHCFQTNQWPWSDQL